MPLGLRTEIFTEGNEDNEGVSLFTIDDLRFTRADPGAESWIVWTRCSPSPSVPLRSAAAEAMADRWGEGSPLGRVAHFGEASVSVSTVAI